jgi:hypothetical protein
LVAGVAAAMIRTTGMTEGLGQRRHLDTNELRLLSKDEL